MTIKNNEIILSTKEDKETFLVSLVTGDIEIEEFSKAIIRNINEEEPFEDELEEIEGVTYNYIINDDDSLIVLEV